MSKVHYKVVAGARELGTALSEQFLFENVEDALASVRRYIAEQRRTGGHTAIGKVMIEEILADGSVFSHAIK